MTHTAQILVVSITMLTAVASADAQTCMGLAPFASGRIQVGAGAEFGNDAQAFTGALSVGSRAGAFGGVSISRASYDDPDGNATLLAGQLGWQLPLGTEGRVQLCPVGGVAYSFGPNDIESSGTDASAWLASFGLQLGISAGTDPNFQIVPTVGAALAYLKSSFEGGFIEFDFDETFGLLNLGLGLIMNSRVSVLPVIEVPVGLEDSDPVFGIAVTVNFGPRP